MDVASEYLQARWMCIREAWKVGGHYAKDYANYVHEHPWHFSEKEVRVAKQLLQCPDDLYGIDYASRLTAPTAFTPTEFTRTAPTLPPPQCFAVSQRLQTPTRHHHGSPPPSEIATVLPQDMMSPEEDRLSHGMNQRADEIAEARQAPDASSVSQSVIMSAVLASF